jgi:hypothetical protein
MPRLVSRPASLANSILGLNPQATITLLNLKWSPATSMQTLSCAGVMLSEYSGH